MMVRTLDAVRARAAKLHGSLLINAYNIEFEERLPTSTAAALAVDNYYNIMMYRGHKFCRLARLNNDVMQRRIEEAAGHAVALNPMLAGNCSPITVFMQSPWADPSGLPFYYCTRAQHVSPVWQFPGRTDHYTLYYIPFHVDYVRYAFYVYSKLVAEGLVVRFACIEIRPDESKSNTSHRVCGAVYADHYVLNIYEDAVAETDFSYRYVDNCRPFASFGATFSNGKKHITPYDHRVLGCQPEDAISSYVACFSSMFAMTACGPDAIFSLRLPRSAWLLSRHDPRPGFGECGLHFGARLPKDGEGRFVVVLPVQQLAIPRKPEPGQPSLRQVAERVGMLYRMLSGEQPTWITPVGYREWDELEWE